jgi:PhoH-like ATPase
VSRNLDGFREQGHLIEGIQLKSGGTLRVALCSRDTLKKLPPELEGDLGDNTILAVALELQQNSPDPVVLVSKDTNLRIKADALGVSAEDYETDKVDLGELYTGMADISVTKAVVDQFYQQGSLPMTWQIYPNQAITLIDDSNPAHTALGVVKSSGSEVMALKKLPTGGISNIRARNREQKFAMELLLNDEIALVTLVGKAGTGKTLLAIAVGLHKVTAEDVYSRLVISRPVIPMGRDLGYLPGDVHEKLTPWMQPLYDNFDLIFGTHETKGKPKYWRRGHEELLEQGILEIEPLTYIRGRSIPQQFLIVDEAQNLTPHEVKTILTRAGEGTKIVLTGDIDQIDNPYVDSGSNGLTYVVERFKHDPLAGHITLVKGERSSLAERASVLL